VYTSKPVHTSTTRPTSRSRRLIQSCSGIGNQIRPRLFMQGWSVSEELWLWLAPLGVGCWWHAIVAGAHLLPLRRMRWGRSCFSFGEIGGDICNSRGVSAATGCLVTDEGLQHITVAGDNYTILVSGEDTAG